MLQEGLRREAIELGENEFGNGEVLSLADGFQPLNPEPR
jgi:hypothetical protein